MAKHEFEQYSMTFKSTLTSIAAAAAAVSLQSCPTLCNPIDGSPPGSPVPGILQARTLEWVAIAFSEPPLLNAKLSYITEPAVCNSLS